MAAFDDYKTYLIAAQTAAAAGSYSTARDKVTLARMSLAQIPDNSADGVDVRFRMGELLELVAAINDAESRAAQRTNRVQFSTVTNLEPGA